MGCRNNFISMLAHAFMAILFCSIQVQGLQFPGPPQCGLGRDQSLPATCMVMT
jgi:hypothetical protein